jgi:predicted ATPase/transcriptional regulator with XRE-family HTH domain/Tfp pilus assembly protein PilF
MLTSFALPDTFAESLRFLRKRSRLTQDELGRAVGYSREQIARLENGSRLPDLAVVAALFVPALLQKAEEQLVEQFLTLAGKTRTGQQVTVTHTRQTRLQLVSETVVVPESILTPPAPLLPLIGRTADVADLLALLQTTRLITLVGAPGIGKSRLALEVANLALADFSDGVVFISLADVVESIDVPYAVLQALSLTPAAHQSVDAAIVAYLVPRRLLLVLDNCEHILDSTPIFTAWLARAPHLKLLCTSRVPLDLYGEQEWPLPPLPVPDLAHPPDMVEWGMLPSMQLLLARVRATEPTFCLTAENILPLATLCVALDGLPLALELAAVRLRDMDPHAMVQQLLTLRGNACLSSTWLQQTKRNISERHRTLQAAISWSVQMLPPTQQTAFFHLGVFVGGCSEGAAQAVAATDPGLLALLARANLVNYASGRITLLETLRVFAQDQLIVSGQLASSRQQHAVFYNAFARQVFTGLIGDDQATWMQLALIDHENCLAAIRWALANANGEIAIALAGSLWWFWCRRGLLKLGQEMLQAALQLSTSELSARATALNGLASIHLAQDNYAASLTSHREGLDIRRQIADASGIGTVLHNMGLTAYMMGDYLQALAWLDESIAADPAADPMQAWAHKGIIALDMLDLPQARYWLERAYDLVMQQPEGWAQAFVMHNLADVLREMGDLQTAQTLAQTSLRIFAAMNDSYYLPDPQLVLAQIARDEGDFARANAFAGLALAQYEARQDMVLVASVYLFQAELASKMGEWENASAQFQKARRLRQTVNRPLTPREQDRYQTLSLKVPGLTTSL